MLCRVPAVPGALDHLAGALVHDLGGEVFRPAARAVQVPALQSSHHLHTLNIRHSQTEAGAGTAGIKKPVLRIRAGIREEHSGS